MEEAKQIYTSQGSVVKWQHEDEAGKSYSDQRSINLSLEFVKQE